MSSATGISVLVFVAVGSAAYAVIASRGHPHLPDMLSPYSLEPSDTSRSTTRAGFGRHHVLRRAVDLTATAARRARVLRPLERLLKDASVERNAADVLFLQAAAVGITVVAIAAHRGAVLPLAVLVLVAAAPALSLRIAIRRRRRAFAAQLPEALRMLANSLRAGRSFLQGMQAVALEADEPTASELGRVVAQARLGRSMEDALDEVMRRMASADGVLVVASVRMQRRIGGNLAQLLGNVADAIVARDRLRGEVRALTAEGRISAIVLAILPVSLGAVMGFVNPSYMSVLIHDSLGRAMVVGSCLLAAVGFLWMRKAMDIEV